jgi:hypothetical protein
MHLIFALGKKKAPYQGMASAMPPMLPIRHSDRRRGASDGKRRNLLLLEL